MKGIQMFNKLEHAVTGDHPNSHHLLKDWVDRIKALVPEGTFVSGAIREEAKNQYIAMLKAHLDGKMLVVSCSDHDPDRAILSAGHVMRRRIVSKRKRILNKRRDPSYFVKAVA